MFVLIDLMAGTNNKVRAMLNTKRLLGYTRNLVRLVAFDFVVCIISNTVASTLLLMWTGLYATVHEVRKKLYVKKRSTTARIVTLLYSVVQKK